VRNNPKDQRNLSDINFGGQGNSWGWMFRQSPTNSTFERL